MLTPHGQNYDFISDAVTPGNLTKNEQEKPQIIAGFFKSFVASKISPVEHHHLQSLFGKRNIFWALYQAYLGTVYSVRKIVNQLAACILVR